MHTVAVIQARMGSTRLPGKVMLPLDDRFELEHVVSRVGRATTVDEVVVATSTKKADDIVAWCGEYAGATVFRGDEQNVLDRMYRAATESGADEVVRITADCPLVDPAVIDSVVTRRREADVDYAANILERTFPRGLDVEAFSYESFGRVHESATDPAHLEHVTAYFRERPDAFDRVNVASDEVYADPALQDRTDLRLTLDEAADYRLLREIFASVAYAETPAIADVIAHVDQHGLAEINADVAQKSLDDAAGH